jgi:hypothetical protein
MKLIVKIAVGILLAMLIGWAVHDPDDFRHKFWGYSQEEINKSIQNSDDTAAQVKGEMDAQLLESTIHLIELRYGETAASRYRLCHTYPPTTKQHQLECKRLDDRLARDDAKREKHPW